MNEDDFAATPANEQAALDTLYDGNAKRPLPDAPKGELHSYSVVGALLDRRDRELFSEGGLNTAARQQLRRTFADIGRIGLPDGIVAQIAEAHIDALLAATRVKSDAEADADALAKDQQTVANNTELREKFAAQYGAKDGEALLARTEKFARANPALAAILKENGIGSNIEIVEGIAAHVHSSGYR